MIATTDEREEGRRGEERREGGIPVGAVDGDSNEETRAVYIHPWNQGRLDQQRPCARA
jgi:hypothetical protein